MKPIGRVQEEPNEQKEEPKEDMVVPFFIFFGATLGNRIHTLGHTHVPYQLSYSLGTTNQKIWKLWWDTLMVTEKKQDVGIEDFMTKSNELAYFERTRWR